MRFSSFAFGACLALLCTFLHTLYAQTIPLTYNTNTFILTSNGNNCVRTSNGTFTCSATFDSAMNFALTNLDRTTIDYIISPSFHSLLNPAGAVLSAGGYCWPKNSTSYPNITNFVLCFGNGNDLNGWCQWEKVGGPSTEPLFWSGDLFVMKDYFLNKYCALSNGTSGNLACNGARVADATVFTLLFSLYE